jgi:hypothetical protein
MNQLQMKIPVFFEIFSKIGNVPEPLIPILHTILDKVKGTFIGNPHSLPAGTESSHLACYPSLPVIHQRGIFEADGKKSSGTCRKTGTRHPSLLPGIFTVFCPHGKIICFLSLFVLLWRLGNFPVIQRQSSLLVIGLQRSRPTKSQNRPNKMGKI